MPLQIEPMFLVFGAILFVVMLASGASVRLLREANQAVASGEFAKALDAYLRILEGRSPGALWLKWKLGKDLIQGSVAAMLLALGRAADAIDVCQRALPHARQPRGRTLLRQAAAHACATLGDTEGLDKHLAELRQLAGTSSQPWTVYHFHAVGRNREIGRLNLAVAALNELVNLPLAGSICPHSTTVPLLASVGRSDDVFSLVNTLLGTVGPQASSLLDRDAAAIKNYLSQAALAELLEHAFDAACQANRSDLQSIYAAALRDSAGPVVALRLHALGVHARLAAAAGNRIALADLLQQMEAEVARQPQNSLLPSIRGVHAGRARQLLGDHDLAVAEYSGALDGPLSPIDRSRVHRALAESLEELDRHDDAGGHRDHARALAPLAWWNAPSNMDPALAGMLDDCVNRLRDQGTAAPATALDPVPPVASKLACATWVLAVLSMIPLVGAAFGGVLAAVSSTLFVQRCKLAHDRRVALAGMVFAAISIAVTAVVVLHIRYPARADEAAGQATAPAWADEWPSESDPALATRYAEEWDAKHGQEQDEAVAEMEDALTEPDDEASGSAELQEMRVFPEWVDSVAMFVLLILSIVFHEIGHAVAAYWAGDPTARDLRRFSLNPLRHVDIAGSIIVPAVLAFTGSPVIGWAKPVPISPHRFRRARIWSLGVSLAGVSLNLLLALLATNLIIVFLIGLVRTRPDFYIAGDLMRIYNWQVAGTGSPMLWHLVLKALVGIVLLNALLAAFNLLPFPPLDGFAALRALLPGPLGRLAAKLSNLGLMLFIFALVAGWVQYLLFPGVFLAMALLGFAQIIAGA